MKEISKAQCLILSSFISGYKDINKKSIENTIPKLRFDPILISLILNYHLYDYK